MRTAFREGAGGGQARQPFTADAGIPVENLALDHALPEDFAGIWSGRCLAWVVLHRCRRFMRGTKWG